MRKEIKSIIAIVAMLLNGGMAFAQATDPVVMTINGKQVLRSEYEYSYNKNNSENVIDKKSVEEYVDLFVNYKLKVQAALDAHLDTLSSFKKEFATYRNQQIRSTVITDADIETEACKIYKRTQHYVDSLGGLVKLAHILLVLPQRASSEVQTKAKERIDSIYNALLRHADFAELARKYSQDKESAIKGGELPWIQPGVTFKEFEDVAYSLKKGEISKPFLSPAGYHIVMMKDRRNYFDYDSLRADIIKFIDQRNIREQIIDARLNDLAKLQHCTTDKVLEDKTSVLIEKDPSLKYLVQEYHDGLLFYEISNRMIWERANKDEAGQEEFFRKNKKRYRWDAPRFKGMAYNTKDKADIKAVKNVVKKLPFDKWADVLRTIFNNDSVLRIRVEKGLFKKGDNALVDHDVFGVDAIVKPMEGYPYGAVFGKKLKAPKEREDVKAEVLADYQEQLEKDWVAQLRKKYSVVVNREVLKTVNKH